MNNRLSFGKFTYTHNVMTIYVEGLIFQVIVDVPRTTETRNYVNGRTGAFSNCTALLPFSYYETLSAGY